MELTREQAFVSLVVAAADIDVVVRQEARRVLIQIGRQNPGKAASFLLAALQDSEIIETTGISACRLLASMMSLHPDICFNTLMKKLEESKNLYLWRIQALPEFRVAQMGSSIILCRIG
ncbi:MAG: hypothetical protein EZS28_005405 [Streblomastix strix]|uniref:Clathrin/coatomer adaptor adaptin-like N-terminal domain-containing protein n=1 Tax=Streblomastix strix TaxID=222440 RepID=A0A5J4WVM6_9EUKA|nr:MAG: hypothetical protein EZS28_005405 [Streblomastix strix]